MAPKTRARGEFVWVQDGVGDNPRGMYHAQLVVPMREMNMDKMEDDDEVEIQFTTTGIYDFVLHRNIDYTQDDRRESKTPTRRSRKRKSLNETSADTAKKQHATAVKSPQKPAARTSSLAKKTSVSQTPMKGKLSAESANSVSKKATATRSPSRKTTKRKVAHVSVCPPVDKIASAPKAPVVEAPRNDEKNISSEPPAKRRKKNSPEEEKSLVGTLIAPLKTVGVFVASEITGFYRGFFGGHGGYGELTS